MAISIPSIAAVEPGGDIANALKKLNEVTKGKIENKYAPLTTAIKAQNALSYNSRTGNLGMFLRSIAQMPVAERQAYLADPANRKNYMKMMEEFRSGINSPSSSGNILSPEFLSSFGFGNAPSNPLSTANIPQGQSNNAFSSQPAPQQSNAQQGGDSSYGSYVPPPSSGNLQPLDNVSSPEDATSNEMPAATEPSSSQVRPLSAEERGVVASQQQSNAMTAGKVQSARADGAATMDKYLMDNQHMFSQAINDAIKYQGIYGRGKNWLDKFKQAQPEEYANYQFVKKSLLDNVGNQIRFMEHMGATDTQSAKAHDMIAALDKLDQSPETSRKVINKSIDSLMKLSSAIYDVAEPRYPGTHRKLFGIPELKGDYIPTPESSKKEDLGDLNNVEKVFDLSQFKSDDELRDWFKKQSKGSQKQIRRQLAAGVL
jgi:hypothetical protein